MPESNINAVNANPQFAQKSNGPTALGTFACAGSGAGLGYLGYKLTEENYYESLSRYTLNLKDRFVKQCKSDANFQSSKLNMGGNGRYQNFVNPDIEVKICDTLNQSEANTLLEKCKSAKFKYVVGGTALLTATYLGLKAFFNN